MEWQRDLPYDHSVVDLLVPAVPTEADIQQLLRDTEEKLKLNACSVEQSLKELQSKMGDQWGGERPSSPSDILQWFNPRNPNGIKPTATAQPELLDFYRALQQYLRSEESRAEEVVLQLLVNISCQCGVSFPSPSPLTSQLCTPVLPTVFCTVRDDPGQELQDAWEDLRLQLQRHLLERLDEAHAGGVAMGESGVVESQGDGEEEGEDVEASRVPKRALLLQQLLFLYPEAEVLARYQRLRTRAVQSLIQATQASGPAAGERGFQRLATGMEAAVVPLCSMISEDLHVLNCVGVEPGATLGFLNQAYLGTLSLELGTLMEREVEGAQKDNTAPQGKGGRRLSRSKATVVPQEPVRKARNFCLTSHQLGCLTRLASTLLELERRVEELAADQAFPQEPVRKARNFCLTSHQLGCLTRLASTLLELERRVEELAADQAFLISPGEASFSSRVLKKSKEEPETAAPEDGSSSVHHHHASPGPSLNFTEAVASSLEFGWRGAFADLAPQMAHCVRVLLEDVCARSLQKEEASRANSAALPLGNVPRRRGIALTCLEPESPKMIAKFCADVIEELDNLLPLAMVACGDPLLPVRHSFLEVCGSVAQALLARLQERAREVPHHAPFQNLSGLLATSIYLGQLLELYRTELSDEEAAAAAAMPVVQLPTQQCLELSSALQEQLTGYCVSTCASCLLLDAESHYWADVKPFYEDERCSFSIQMWHYFLAGVRSDLWRALSPEVARCVLAQVLCESLQPLVQRYSHARPSYGRVQQVRLDISSILLCVQQMLWSVCEGPGELLASEAKSSSTLPGSSSAADWLSGVHGLCTQLLDVLVVVTAPLPLLYGIFQSGPKSPAVHAAQTVDDLNNGAGAPTNGETEPGDLGLSDAYWLSVINPVVFPEHSLKDGVGSEVCCLWLLRLVCAGPGVSSSLLLTTLLHTDCLLLRTLMKESGLCVVEVEEVEGSAERLEAADRFLEAVVSLLASLSKAPRALTQVLEPYLDKRQLWEQLHNNTDSEKSADSVVLRCIRRLVSRPVEGLLRQLVHIVQASDDWPGSLLQRDAPDCLLSKVPKGWNYSPHDAKGKDPNKATGKTIAIQALSFVFTNLPAAVSSLPLPIRFLFAEAEERLPRDSSRQLRPTAGLLPWALLGCLCRGLEDAEALERLAAQPLERGAKERLALLSECLQASVGQPKGGAPKAAAHTALRSLEERRPKWIAGQLHKARKLCCKSMFERLESEGLQERGGGGGGGGGVSAPSAAAAVTVTSVTAAEAGELRTHLMALESSHQAGGSLHLQHIHHIITHNQELLWHKLSAPFMPDEELPQSSFSSVTFDLSEETTPGTAPQFNPLTEFNHFGYEKFDQAALCQREWAWAALLPAFQAMSGPTFTTLLQNRWEMQQDADLEDEEKVLVDHLRNTWLTPRPDP
ncbi:uncharacterized protein KIAA0825 homolog [Engraulis encrasicolus]|uniref:uncharacterized protein KIAA0825 homolog n=1 Tax=Engraulis encrasicolus TaxID=184585 RepID=UPI002FD2D770